MDQADVKERVRARYGSIAETSGTTDCCTPATSCCGPSTASTAEGKSRQMGYSEAELAAVPEGANLGLGCGNPQAIAALQPGESKPGNDKRTARSRAILTFSALVGAMSLARAVSDKALSREILDTVAELLKDSA